MGLDMYLKKVTREEIGYWRKANQIHKWFSDHVADGNIENLENYYVSKEQLKELRDTCQKVLNYCSTIVKKKVKVKEYDYDKKEYVEKEKECEVLEDPSLAQELLPTESGFFYGSTDYDEWYLDDLTRTIELIDKVLKEVDFDECSIEYQAWW